MKRRCLFEQHPVTVVRKKIARTFVLAGDGEPFEYRMLQVVCGVENHSCQALYRVVGRLSISCLLVSVENTALLLFFARVGGFLSANANFVEKLSHIRGIKPGQSRMARIVLSGAGDGDLGRMIENRPSGAVFEF